MTWTVDDVEGQHGYRPVGGDTPTNDPELALGVVLAAGLLGWGAWDALAATSVVAAGAAVGALAVAGVALLVRLGRSGLLVGRRGLVVRPVLRRRVVLAWGEVAEVALVERPLTPWRVLRIEAQDGRRIWVADVRTQVGAARVRRRRPLEPLGPGVAEEIVDRLEELRRRASGSVPRPA